MKRLPAAIGSLLLALLVVGCGTTSTGQKSSPGATPKATTTTKPAPTGKNRASVGQSLIITGGGGLKANVTLESAKAYQQGAGQFSQPPQHGFYVVTNIKIVLESGTYNFNPLYFKLVSTDGNAYNAFDGNAISAGYEPMLSAGTLNAGQSTGGNVTFDVPAQHGVLQLSDPLGGIVGEWTV